MKVLIVDDDRVLADVVAFTLRREGFEVIQAYDGVTALDRWTKEEPALVILDVNLPKMDGFMVCQRIREEGDTPVLLLTVRGEEDDIVLGLDTGADDYIVKPFSPRQLVARVRAILRRADLRGAEWRTAGQAGDAAPAVIGDLRFDNNRREVRIAGGNPVALTPLEARLLACLWVNNGNVMTTDGLIDHVWGPSGGDRDMLRQLVRRLRNKIEKDPSKPTYIHTVPGLGYGLLVDH